VPLYAGLFMFCMLMCCNVCVTQMRLSFVKYRLLTYLLTYYGVCCRRRRGWLLPLSRLLQRRRRRRTRHEGSRSDTDWTNAGRLCRTVPTYRLPVLRTAARQTMFLRRQLRHPRCKHQLVSAYSEHTYTDV